MNKEKTKQEARAFFLDFQKHYEKLAADFPERKKVCWWHKIFGTRPRGEIYEWAVENCKTAIKALDEDDIKTVADTFDKFIQWYEWEKERFSDSMMEINSNAALNSIIKSMKRMKDALSI